MTTLGTDTFTYHPNRLLATAHGGLYTTDIDRSTLNTSYDMANRLIQEQEKIDATAGYKTLSYQYTPDSLLSQTTYPNTTVAARTYNANRLLYQTKIGGTVQATFTYDAADRRSQRLYANNVRTNWTPDANDRETDLKHSYVGGMTPVTLQEWNYRYTNADDPLVQDDVTPMFTVHGQAYQYDGLHQLQHFQRGTVSGNTVPSPLASQDWTLSKVGDWNSWATTVGMTTTTDNRTHNNIHALTARSAPSSTQAYDTNFNQTDDGINYLLSYDANDQLQQVTTRGMMPTTIATYRYDAIGRRIEKNVGGTITRYYYAGQQIVEERDGADSTQAFYTYGDYIDEPLTMDRGGARYYYQANRLYSTYLLTDTTGAIAERYTYTPYGVATTFTSTYTTPQSTSRLGNPYLFTGRELDGETLLYYYRARTYDPVQGRFKQLDPMGLVTGINLFEYLGGSSTTFLDPSGLEANAPLSKDIEHCTDVCGPDVTAWFFNDIKAHIDIAKVSVGQGELKTRIDEFRIQAAYLMAHKWMPFEEGTKCATGRCVNTVMLAGICIRKNQLGNMMFGIIGAMYPPGGPPFQTGPDVMRFGYSLGSKYDPNHPFAANSGASKGLNRADNLAAFGIGSTLASSFSAGKVDANNFSQLLSTTMASPAALNACASLYPTGATPTLTLKELAYAPEFGGFNTMSCRPCQDVSKGAVVKSGVTSAVFGMSLRKYWADKTGKTESFDKWVQKKFEDYSKPYKAP